MVQKSGKLHQLGVSQNSGTPKSSILIRFSTINHAVWGAPFSGNIQLRLIVYQSIRPLFTVQGFLAPSIQPVVFQIARFLKLPSSQYHLKEMRLVWLVGFLRWNFGTQKKRKMICSHDWMSQVVEYGISFSVSLGSIYPQEAIVTTRMTLHFQKGISMNLHLPLASWVGG